MTYYLAKCALPEMYQVRNVQVETLVRILL